MDFAEAGAKRILETVLPGARLEYQHAQSRGEYDFGLQYVDGSLAAVEVTRSVDQLQMRTSAAIHSKKKRPAINADKCRNTWMIMPLQNADINPIREKIDTYLSALEGAGIGDFSYIDALNSRQMRQAGLLEFLGQRAVPLCVENICYDLKIQGGSVISSEEPAKIILTHPIYGGAVGVSCAIEAGKAECWKDDNRKKLGAANTNERHLVVYVEVTKGLAWTALTEFDPPATLPELPPEISHIWLVGDIGHENKNKFVVWRASASEIWQKSEVAIL